MTQDLYKQTIAMVDSWIDSGEDVLSAAAVLSIMSLTLYRTVLDEEDYQHIVDSISQSRNQIQTWSDTRTKLH